MALLPKIYCFMENGYLGSNHPILILADSEEMARDKVRFVVADATFLGVLQLSKVKEGICQI